MLFHRVIYSAVKVSGARFPVVKTFSVEEKLGGWDALKQKHFADESLFDQMVVNR